MPKLWQPKKGYIYVSQSDFHVCKNAITDAYEDIEFHLNFEIERPEEAGLFNDLLVQLPDGKQRLELHFKYSFEGNRVKYKVWGGANEGQSIAPEVLFLIYHVHLDALRDAEQYLRPIRGNRLGQLYSNILIDPDKKTDAEKKKELAKKVRASVEGDNEWIGHVAKGREKINEHLKETSFTHRQQNVDVLFLPFDFNRLADNLKIQMPVYSDALLEGDNSKQKHFELHQNGLGYNNLIYTATVLGDLKQKKDVQSESYAALLIEEPEAHLHPQLQNLFFEYLNKLDQQQGFQIFITSHSPTITAKANLNTVIVLQNQNHHLTALSLSQSGLTPENSKYLHKFLDVTKSQLFFATGVILVEGISEALLMPVFGKIIGAEYDIEKSGVELVNLNGVAFSHFANLFNNNDDAKNLKTRCSLITDDDRASETEEISSRAKIAVELAAENLKVFLGELTFEFELFKAGNEKVMLEIFKEMHPKSAAKIQPSEDINVYATNFLEKVIANKAKSELAHRLAVRLSVDKNAAESFKVPVYLQSAIKFAVKGE